MPMPWTPLFEAISGLELLVEAMEKQASAK